MYKEFEIPRLCHAAAGSAVVQRSEEILIKEKEKRMSGTYHQIAIPELYRTHHHMDRYTNGHTFLPKERGFMPMKNPHVRGWD